MKKFLLVLLVLALGAGFAWWRRGSLSQKTSAPMAQATPTSAAGKESAGRLPAARTPVAEPGPLQQRDASLRELNTRSEKPWQATIDPQSSRVRTLAQGSLAIANRAPEKAALEFVETYATSLFGVSPKTLGAPSVLTTDRVKVLFPQLAGDIPILGATLALIYENGSLTRVMNDLVPCGECTLSGSPALDDSVGQRLALAAAGAPPGMAPPKLDRTVAFASQKELIPTYVYHVQPKGTAGPHYEVLVDAIAGSVLRARNILRY